jgi:rhamnose utilization protein RhaD (predicted bifunctional aldolase and dehydrogenase)
MRSDSSAAEQARLAPLRELSARIGGDPLLTQASTGNTSIKLGNVLWIKASGRWLADAKHDDILVPLQLNEVKQYINRQVDPSEVYAGASIETAMHAVVPHPVVLHVHSVNTIAWAVRQDARYQLERRLKGLQWQWIPYVPSGLPLAREIERVSSSGEANVFVLGNHGLVIAGDDCDAVENLLSQVEKRLTIRPRKPDNADYDALYQLAERSSWDLPDDDSVHALATDPTSQAILSGGILFPCQSMFSNSSEAEVFRAVPCSDLNNGCESQYRARPFLMVEGRGVVIRRDMTRCQRAMMGGLAQVVQRINSSAPIHYLTNDEVEYSVRTIASRYNANAEPVQYS